MIDRHRDELEVASAIDPAVITERGYRTLESRDRDDLAAQGICVRSDANFPGLLIPIYRATGEPISAQFKPAKPITIKGRSVKYVSPRGQSNHLDVHPRNHARIQDITVPLWITEGVKKGDSLTSRGCCVVTLTGVYNWRSKHGTLGDWEDIPLKGRDVVLVFDADAKQNMNVARAMVRLGRWCSSKGAKSVRYLIVPAEVNGKPTKGADDYFAAGGTLDSLVAVASTSEPDTESADDTFTDARLAETIADEVLGDRYVWCKALGWLGYIGQRYAAVTEEAVGEAVRKYALVRFTRAVQAGQKAAMSGWQSMLSTGRLRSVLTLARGIVEKQADDFDADPDLLNTPAGVVELQTGRILPHDPELLLTKITRGCYKPGAVHPDWEQAITAVREDARRWLQVRVGQAITGHPTPDGRNVVEHGTGENGKTVVNDGIVVAFGDYAAPASPKLITSKDEHSIERADLRGQRFLIAEELTEDRSLNVTAIKQITDVGTIKARYVHRDNMTFPATHSLFITTNYIPNVNETDHGTWRRFALLTFPYTFRKPGEPLVAKSDRRGDPHLKGRIRSGATGQHDAIVTWAVEGARQWYWSGLPELPASVEADTRSWRRQADRILAYWDECLVADPDACVITSELLVAFNTWLKAGGHHEWSKELFHPRFKAHAETVQHHVEERRKKAPTGLSRPPGAVWSEPAKQPVIYLGVRFREVDEIDEHVEENTTVAEVADLQTNPSREDDPGKFGFGSARSATSCCEGGPFKLRCQLCKHSPTYWQRASEVVD